MDRAGMGHALQKIHRLLKPDGRLIDIHPTSDPPPIEVRIGQQVSLAGWLKESNDFVGYDQADDALAQAVRDGLFAVEREATFSFLTRADTLAELRAYLAEEWKDAIIDETTAMRVEDLLLAYGDVPGCDREQMPRVQVILSERVRITRLRPVHATLAHCADVNVDV